MTSLHPGSYVLSFPRCVMLCTPLRTPRTARCHPPWLVICCMLPAVWLFTVCTGPRTPGFRSSIPLVPIQGLSLGSVDRSGPGSEPGPGSGPRSVAGPGSGPGPFSKYRSVYSPSLAGSGGCCPCASCSSAHSTALLVYETVKLLILL